MAHSYKRSIRVSELITKEISEMLVRGRIKDPRVSSVNITAVRVSDDLGHAKVFFTCLDRSCDTDRVLSGLTRASGYIKGLLAKRLKMKKIPSIGFEYDSLAEKTARIDEIIRNASDDGQH